MGKLSAKFLLGKSTVIDRGGEGGGGGGDCCCTFYFSLEQLLEFVLMCCQIETPNLIG